MVKVLISMTTQKKLRQRLTGRPIGALDTDADAVQNDDHLAVGKPAG